MRWNGNLCIDATLPFCPRPAPMIFCSVANALEWIIRSLRVPLIVHYMDDFIIIGLPGSLECQQNLWKALRACDTVMLARSSSQNGGAIHLYDNTRN